MPSRLDIAIRRYRRLVNQRDRAALLRLMQAYTEALAELRPLIALAQAEALRLGPAATADDIVALLRYQELERQLVAALQRLGALTAREIASGQAFMVSVATQAALGLAEAQGGARIVQRWVRLPTSAMEDLIGRLHDGQSLDRYVTRLTDAARDGIARELQRGLALGRHPTAVADAVTKAFNVSRHRALSAARTEMLSAYRSALIRAYQANADVLDGWRWVSALHRSCAACVAMHGRVFPLSESWMKAHVRCRCAAVPVVRGVEVPFETGEAWFARQDAGYQDRVLRGSAAGELYREGRVRLTDFVHLERDRRWGDAYVQGSLDEAKARAERRTRGAA